MRPKLNLSQKPRKINWIERDRSAVETIFKEQIAEARDVAAHAVEAARRAAVIYHPPTTRTVTAGADEDSSDPQ
jgi:hypothetical protein